MLKTYKLLKKAKVKKWT